MTKIIPDKRAGSDRWDDIYPMFIWKFSSHSRDEKKYFQTCVVFILICFFFNNEFYYYFPKLVSIG